MKNNQRVTLNIYLYMTYRLTDIWFWQGIPPSYQHHTYLDMRILAEPPRAQYAQILSTNYIHHWRKQVYLITFKISHQLSTVDIQNRGIDHVTVNGYNFSIPSDAYMPQYYKPPYILIKVCHMYGTIPLSEIMLPYCQMDFSKQISLTFESKYNNFHSRKLMRKVRMQNAGH